MSTRWVNLLWLGLFIATVIGARAWFTEVSADGSGLVWLQPAANVSGYDFAPEPLSDVVQEILGKPDFINGTFTASDAPKKSLGVNSKIRLFSANWAGAKDHGMTVLQHTPDICWVGAGWQSVDLKQPGQVSVRLDSCSHPQDLNAVAHEHDLEFECRAFLSPDGRTKELVIWCTVVGGRILSESSRFRASKQGALAAAYDSPMEKPYAAGRRLSADLFAQAVRQRLRTRGTKQFVRISSVVNGDPMATLDKLRQFASRLVCVDTLDNAVDSTSVINQAH